MDAEPAAATRSAGRRNRVSEGCAFDAARVAPHLRDPLAPGPWRHLQAVEILGHPSVAVTEAHYAHLLKEDLAAASQLVLTSCKSYDGACHRHRLC